MPWMPWEVIEGLHGFPVGFLVPAHPAHGQVIVPPVPGVHSLRVPRLRVCLWTKHTGRGKEHKKSTTHHSTNAPPPKKGGIKRERNKE